MQVVRGRGNRATDGTFRPTPTAPRQVGLIPPGPPGSTASQESVPRPASPQSSLYLWAPNPTPSPLVPSGSEGVPSWIHVNLNVTPAGKKS